MLTLKAQQLTYWIDEIRSNKLISFLRDQFVNINRTQCAQRHILGEGNFL